MRAHLSYSLCLLFAVAGCTGDNPDTGDGLASTASDLAGVSEPDGGGGDTDLGGGGTLTVAQACEQLAGAICDKLGQCSPFYLQTTYGDRGTCVQRVQLTCAPYVNLSGSSWTVDRLRACSAGYAAGTCADYFAAGGPAACRPQPGKVADGAACANSNQCQSAYCAIGTGGCGTCVKAAKVGEACTTAKPCDLGLSCNAGKCAAPGGRGVSCGFGGPGCQVGLYCQMEVCQPQLGAGATCNANAFVAECDPVKGLYCGQSGKCEAYKVAAADAACGTVNGATTVCAAGGTCASSMGARRCVAAAKDGAMCSVTTGPSCMSPAYCGRGTCGVFDPATCR